MNKFYIVGLGPGNLDYTLPVAIRRIEKSDCLVGGRRNLDSLKKFNKEEFVISSNLKESIEFIKKNRFKKNISVVLSGDTGFFSMLGYISKNFSKDDYLVIPGISSLQYMYSKLGIMYNDSFLSSVHGRDLDYIKVLENNKTVGLLTDTENTPKKIAEKLLLNSKKYNIYIGENLSYEDEKISIYKVDELFKLDKEFSDLNVVIIENI